MVTGNRNILNSIKGITSVVKLTAEEKTALADRVLPANVLVVDSSNIIYLTDGVTAVKALNPLLASSNNYAYDKDVVHLTGDETINGTKTFSAAIVGSVTGNAGSATKLATARTINGTSFNGTANITTANWGTARNITITDGTNTSTAVSVNGSANVSLNLPSTIKATFVGNVTGNVTGNCSGSSGSCTGNAATATKLAAKRTIALSGAATGTATGFDGSGNIAIPVTSLDASKLTGTASVSTTGNAATATTATTATNATYANWLRTSSHSDHLFHTEWDKAGYFWTYVTTGNGDYRAVRVARSDSAATAQACTGNAATATKLATARTIALSGAATGTATAFDGSGNITIPVTSLDASKLTGTASVSTTGNADTATQLRTPRKINGTDFDGTANITTANWGTARDITIADSTGDNTGEAVSVNGSAAVTLKLPATIKASLDGNAATATSATTAASATTATNATNAAKLGNIASSGYVQTGKVNQTIDGTKTFSAAIVGSVTGNAGSATKLATARTINGTGFNGTANITTANWGTARDITIADSTGDNTGEAVSVNGSAAVTLKLPATIKATGLTVTGDANFANITASYITGLFTD